MENIIQIPKSNEKGDYFLKLLKIEKDKLEGLVLAAECELDSGRTLSEEVSGKLRIAAGKARLLMCRKFQQFEDLCRRNLEKNPKDRFSVTSDDLAGYWDVLIVQITQVHDIFDQSHNLMKNKYQKSEL